VKASFSTILFADLPVVGILRGLPPARLRPVLEAARQGGLTNVEITMNTSDAEAQIRAACEMSRGAFNVGAGTVTNLKLLEQAIEAGASFIVTPTVVEPVVQRCVTAGLPVFPGAFSPAEIVRAWELGATCVKLFPAETYGTPYLRQLKQQFPKVRLMPTGGVDVQTLKLYCQAGADAFGVGSPLFRTERIAAEDWRWIADQCRAFRQAYQAAREQG
jgi:2-dehydro-3-deoxyphosphogluconate aldolase/(4S)-4-hydroxy-2-oxoglutarate aldolase